VTFAFFAGGILVFFVITDFYLLLVAELVYFLGGVMVLNRVVDGVSEQQAYTFPYSGDLVSRTVPKVIESYYVWKRFVETDSASGHYVIQLGSGRRGLLMTIAVGKIDDGAAEVKVRCETNQFFEFGSLKSTIAVFFRGLHVSLEEGRYGEDSKNSARPSLDCTSVVGSGYFRNRTPVTRLSRQERRVPDLIIVLGFIVGFAVLGTAVVSQYAFEIGFSIAAVVLFMFLGLALVLIGVGLYGLKLRRHKHAPS
jgi:hypothetical protein